MPTRRLQRFRLLALLTLLPLSLAQSSISCFAPDGETIADDSYRPCNNLGLAARQRPASSCCRLNAVPDTREACDASGLCVQGDIVRRGFCTDSSWEAEECVRFCMSDGENGSVNGSVEVTPCGDGSFCCGSNDTCCGSSLAFTPPDPSPATATPSTVTATTTSESVRVRDETPLAVYIGMGAGILVALLVGLGAALFLGRRVRALKRRNGQLLGSVAIRGSRAPVLPPTPHVGSMQDFADFKAMYGEVIAKREGVGLGGAASSVRSDTETAVGSAVLPAGREERDSDSVGKAPPIPPIPPMGR